MGNVMFLPRGWQSIKPSFMAIFGQVRDTMSHCIARRADNRGLAFDVNRAAVKRKRSEDCLAKVRPARPDQPR